MENGQPTLDVYVPDELEPGVYANALSAWHTEHEFTLDFATLRGPRVGEDGEIVLSYRVVTRVKLPATMIFEVIRELNRDMTEYEREFGEIRRPGRPGA